MPDHLDFVLDSAFELECHDLPLESEAGVLEVDHVVGGLLQELAELLLGAELGQDHLVVLQLDVELGQVLLGLALILDFDDGDFAETSSEVGLQDVVVADE